jgi:hypothetical protein
VQHAAESCKQLGVTVARHAEGSSRTWRLVAGRGTVAFQACHLPDIPLFSRSATAVIMHSCAESDCVAAERAPADCVCCRSEQDMTAGMLAAALRLPPPDMDSML